MLQVLRSHYFLGIVVLRKTIFLDFLRNRLPFKSFFLAKSLPLKQISRISFFGIISSLDDIVKFTQLSDL